MNSLLLRRRSLLGNVRNTDVSDKSPSARSGGDSVYDACDVMSTRYVMDAYDVRPEADGYGA